MPLCWWAPARCRMPPRPISACAPARVSSSRPGSIPSLVAPCRAAGAILMSGAMTPTEVRAARKAGAQVVKIFPASFGRRTRPYQVALQCLPRGRLLPDRRRRARAMSQPISRRARLCRHGRQALRRGTSRRGRSCGGHRRRRTDHGLHLTVRAHIAKMAVDLLCIGEPLLEYNHSRQRMMAACSISRAMAGTRPTSPSPPPGRAPGRLPHRDWRRCRRRLLLALLEGEGIDTSTVKRSIAHPTGAYFVTHGPDGHRFTFTAEARRHRHWPSPISPRSTIADARLVFASGISQGISESAADAIFHAFAVARSMASLSLTTPTIAPPSGRRSAPPLLSTQRSARPMSRCRAWKTPGC